MSSNIIFGNANSGLQAGIINGSAHFHAPPVHVEPPPSPSIVIPFSRDEKFIDREDTIGQGSIISLIHQKCRRPGSRTALFGIGGVGKSQLAIEYAYRVREQSPDTWVFWIHASNAARFRQSVRDIAGCAKIYGRQDPNVDILQLVHDWLHGQANGPWMVILDNVDDTDVLAWSTAEREAGSPSSSTNSSRSLLSYIPYCQHGSVLVTSRNREVARNIVEEADIITIEPMNAEDAINLFRKKLSQPGAGDSAERIKALVVALDQMPLAIVQAAAYISRRWPRCSLQQYLEDYQASDAKKSGLLSYEGGGLRRDAEAKNSILLTWQISFDHIQQTRPSAADMLSLMSFCDRQGIPDILLRDVNPPEPQLPGVWSMRAARETTVARRQPNAIAIDHFEDDILALQEFAFIRASEDGQSFEMHRLVQLATQEWLQLHAKEEHWRHQFLMRLRRQMPTGVYENWATCRVLFPHAQKAAAEMPSRRDSVAEWATVMYYAAWYCMEMRNEAEAERLSLLAMKPYGKQLGADDEQVSNAMLILAAAYRKQERWQEAEKLGLQLVEARKKRLGGDHPSTLISIANLSVLYLNQGRWQEAEKLGLQVVEARKRKLGDDHLHTLEGIETLAAIYHEQGQWQKAEKFRLQVVEAMKRRLWDDHPHTLISIGNLASVYLDQGRWQEAEKLELQVMEARKRRLGDDHPDTLTGMGNLASIYKYQGRWQEAEELGLQVVEAMKRRFGDNHPEILKGIGILAAIYYEQGRWQEAEKLELQVIEVRKRRLGDDHLHTLTSIGNLASIYKHQGRWQEAEELGLQVVEARKRRLGIHHPQTWSGMWNLANTYMKQGRDVEAVDLLRECVEAQEATPGVKYRHDQEDKATLAQWVSRLAGADARSVASRSSDQVR